MTAGLLAGAPLLRDPRLVRLLDLLDTDGEEARVIGGAVRNALLGIPPGDIDVATTALPAEVMRRCALAGLEAVPTGLEHGTVTIVIDGVGHEVTTLREDVDTDGRRAIVRFGRSWTADALRRDFTINALSVDRVGNVHDVVGGIADLADRRVRFIGDPATRIREDRLRVLRFFRFHASYARNDVDRDAMSAIIRARDWLEMLSAERVRSELLKLLVARRAAPTLVRMAQTAVLVDLVGVPRLGACARLALLESAYGVKPDPIRRLAALAVRVVEDAERLTDRLRLSRDEARRLAALADPVRRTETGSSATRELLYRLGASAYADRMLVAWAVSGARVDDPAWHEALALPVRWTPPHPPFRAADLMARGLVPGPALGRALALAESDWIARDFPVDDATVDAIVDAAVRAVSAT